MPRRRRPNGSPAPTTASGAKRPLNAWQFYATSGILGDARRFKQKRLRVRKADRFAAGPKSGMKARNTSCKGIDRAILVDASSASMGWELNCEAYGYR